MKEDQNTQNLPQNPKKEANEYAKKLDINSFFKSNVRVIQNQETGMEKKVAIDAGARIKDDFRSWPAAVHCGYLSSFMQTLTNCSINLFRPEADNNYSPVLLDNLVNELQTARAEL